MIQKLNMTMSLKIQWFKIGWPSLTCVYETAPVKGARRKYF